MIWEPGEDIGSQRRKLKIEKDGNESLSTEHKEEIQVIFHKSINLLIGSILDNNNNINNGKLMFET